MQLESLFRFKLSYLIYYYRFYFSQNKIMRLLDIQTFILLYEKPNPCYKIAFITWFGCSVDWLKT